VSKVDWQWSAPVKLWNALWPVVLGSVIAGGFHIPGPQNKAKNRFSIHY
jgi:hypothetical protein